MHIIVCMNKHVHVYRLMKPHAFTDTGIQTYKKNHALTDPYIQIYGNSMHSHIHTHTHIYFRHALIQTYAHTHAPTYVWRRYAHVYWSQTPGNHIISSLRNQNIRRHRSRGRGAGPGSCDVTRQPVILATPLSLFLFLFFGLCMIFFSFVYFFHHRLHFLILSSAINCYLRHSCYRFYEYHFHGAILNIFEWHFFW